MDAGQQLGAVLFEMMGAGGVEFNLVHENGFLKLELVQQVSVAHGLRRHFEGRHEGPGKGFVRAVAGIEGDAQYIRSAGGQTLGRHRQPPGPNIGHDRHTHARIEDTRHVETADANGFGDIVERDIRVEMVFDKPQGLAGGVDGDHA